MGYTEHSHPINIAPGICDEIIARAALVEPETRTIPNARRCVVRWLTAQNGFADLSALVMELIARANSKLWGMVIDGLDRIQYTEYEPGDRYDFHQDCNWVGVQRHRKATLVAQLNAPGDFTGGGLQFRNLASPRALDKGAGVVFPSPIEHRARPVITGRRIVLVAWATGPNFQ